VESADDAATGLRMAGLAPAAVFLGKSAAILVQLLVLELLLTAGIIVFYGSSVKNLFLWLIAGLVTALAVAATGTLYGALASGLGVRETLLPILLLPVLAPVLIGATRAYDDALGAAAVDGWAWTGLLAMFAVVASTLGALAYGALVED